MKQRLRVVANTFFPKGGGSRSALIVSSGHVAGYAVMLAVTPLITRLYGPADFGVFAVYTSLVAMLGLISMASYEVAIPLPEEDSTARGLLALAIGICLVTSASVGILVWWAGESLLSKLQAGELGGLSLVFAVHLVGIGSCEAFTNWFVRKGNFVAVARARFVASVVNALVQVVLVFVIGGAAGLVAGSAAGGIAGGVYLLFRFCRCHGLPRAESVSALRKVAYRYRRYPQLSMPSNLLQRTAILVPPLTLAVFYEPQVVGWYGLAQRALIVPLSLIGLPLSRVYLVEASRRHRRGSDQLRQLFLSTAKKQILYAGVPLFFFVLVAPPLFAVAFGEPWREAGVYCRFVFPMLLLYIIATVLAGTLDVLERQDIHLIRSLVLLALMAAGLTVPWCLGTSPAVAIATLSAAGSAGYLVTIGLVWRAMPNDAGVPMPASEAVATDRHLHFDPEMPQHHPKHLRVGDRSA
ncbi:MAG: lipopolysaccharide biosynthesis protein [Rhodopirellula sp.]|nr:lipopolysaccharide biosynthesis protein [Rhodopirellula sp.]